jgi:hypothetical protein
MATSNPLAPQTRSNLLLNVAVSLSRAFQTRTPPPRILGNCFTGLVPIILEHGPAWAQTRLPFLGREFSGRSKPGGEAGTCDEYFKLLGDTLSYSEMAFGPEAFVLGSSKEGEEIVTVVGTARFSSNKTGKSWRETFTWRLSCFDEEGLIGRWDIWADPLSAWNAVNEVDTLRSAEVVEGRVEEKKRRDELMLNDLEESAMSGF